MANEQFAGLELKNPSDTGKYIRWCGFGASDSGKTSAIGTAALVESMQPVLHLDVEKGSSSLGYLDDNNSMKVLQPRTWTEIQKIYDNLYNLFQKGERPFETVSIDNGTLAQSLGMYKLLGIDRSRAFDADKLAEFKDFNGTTEQVLRMIRAFTDLPCNFLMTAWEVELEDPRTHANKLYPMFIGKLSRKVPGLFDQVHYFYKEEKKGKDPARRVRTQSSPTIVAKTRRIQLPEIIDNTEDTPFTMQMLVDAPIQTRNVK